MKMKAILKRTTGLLVVIAMLISMMPTVFADPTLKFKDFPTGWSKAAVEAAVANGLLNGFEDNTIRPEDNLTRAEMTAIITRAFGAKVKADISAYTDVAPNAWYYDSIAKAVQMGAVNGVSATEMNPDAPITREEVFTILARVLVLSSDNAQVLDKFHDAGKVSSWAKPYVIALTERGYVNGDDLGNANPQANISREEFAQLMHNAIRTYITKAGTYNKDMAGIVVVRVGDVELKNLTVSGDLVIGDGVGTDTFHTTNITVNGRLLARGGTNTLKRTTVSDGVVVNNMNGVTAFMNYRSEVVFAGIIENTKATFLNPPGGGGGGYTPSPTTYSVTFKLTDGTPVGNPIRITLGQPIGAENMPADPTPGVGYDSFLGWFDGTTQITAATVVNGPINAVAKFNPITYTIEYLNPDGSAFSYFDPNFSKKTSFTVEDEAFALPVDANMARKGYTFHDKWLDEKNNEVTTISKAYIQEDTPRVIKLKGDFTINTYTLEYIPKDATLKDGVENPVQYTIKDYQTVVFPEEKDLNVPDDKLFIGWYDGEGTGAKKISALNENDHITKTPDIPIKLYAHFKNVYTITFEVKDEAGAVISSETRRVVEGQSLSNDVLDDAMPEALSEKGYRFGDWMYDGAVFDADTVVTDTMGNITVTATRSMNSYRIVYQGEGTAFNFKDGYDAPRSYNVTNYASIVLPTEEYVELPDNKPFMGWLDGATAITALTDAHLTEDPDTPLTLSLNDETLFKVTFYNGYNQHNQVGNPIYVPALNTGLGDDIPAIADSFYKKGYVKGPEDDRFANIKITALYPEREIHTIRPTYWYEVTKEVDDGNGGTKMVTSLESFNEKTPIIADTNVYILYQKLNMHIKLGSAANEELSISAMYKSVAEADDGYMPEKDTRILDAAKDFGVSARNQLEKAIDFNLLPSQFDDAQDKLFGKLEELDILDSNKMIQVLDIPVAISTLVKREKADDMVKQFVRDSITDPNKLDSLLDIMDIQVFIDQIGTEMRDKDMIKNHINTLPTNDEKIALADRIYNAIANSSDYEPFMNSLLTKKNFTINKSNLPLIQAISNAIGNLDYDAVMAETNHAMLNKVIDTLGDAILKDYFNEMRDGYVGGLDAAIEQVKNGGEGATASYTTSLTLTVNLIGDILKPLYDKAQEEVDEKLRKLPIRYDQNPYAQYLVTHDMLSKVFSGDGVETAAHSGYGIKGILDYYDYLLELFVVADDTFCWYGDDNNVTQEEFDSIYDALFGKVQRVHSKVNGILEAYDESGELPDRIKGIFDRVQQINSLITRFEPQVQAMLDKYFKSSINQGIEDGSIAENEKVLTFVDLMLGQEDPVFTIDSLYDLFYRFEPDMQDKLQELIASGKLRKAIDKFEETSIGSLFKGKGTIGNIAEKIDAIKNGEKVTESLNSVYELLEIVAATGIDAFRVDTGVITDRDVYQFSIAGISVTMTRTYEKQ